MCDDGKWKKLFFCQVVREETHVTAARPGQTRQYCVPNTSLHALPDPRPLPAALLRPLELLLPLLRDLLGGLLPLLPLLGQRRRELLPGAAACVSAYSCSTGSPQGLQL